MPTTTPSLLWYLRPSPNGTIRVAVVGNGPLFERDRVAIERYENIVRFNDMKNWRRNETITLHASRSLRGQHDHWVRNVQLAADHNRTMWAIASEHKFVAEGVDLVSWAYSRDKRYKFFNENWFYQGYMEPQTQVLEPYLESLYLFPNCSACAGNPRCLHQAGKYGPSAGGIVLNALETTPEVDEIAVFGMNWGSGSYHSNRGDHTDFAWSEMVSTCCSKCTIHPTPVGRYFPRGWMEKAKEGLDTAAAVGVGVASTAGAAWAVAAAIGLKHLLHRRRSTKELADVKAAHAEVLAKHAPASQKQANTDAHAGVHMPLLKL